MLEIVPGYRVQPNTWSSKFIVLCFTILWITETGSGKFCKPNPNDILGGEWRSSVVKRSLALQRSQRSLRSPITPYKKLRCDNDSESLTCLRNGTWTWENTTCEQILCKNPLVNVTEEFSNQTRTLSRLSCHQDTTEAQAEVQCMDDGRWRISTTVCDEILCKSSVVEEEEQPDCHGFDSSKIARSNASTVRRVQCNPQALGTNVVSCQADGRWSTSGMFCKEILCQRNNTKVNNTKGVCFFGKPQQFSPGLFLKMSCGPEAMNSSIREEIRCLSDGTWSSSLLTFCDDLYCRPFERVSSSPTTRVPEGTKRRLECHPGYRLDGRLTVTTCQGNGSWTCAGDCATCKVMPQVTSTYEMMIIVIPVVIGFILLLIVIFIVLYTRMKMREKRFNESVFGSDTRNIFNPNLPIEDQVDLLPYKSEWEFPMDRLVLGKVLGQGAFGRVVKGDAIGIVEGQATTPVAVKLLKETATIEHKLALITELKVLMYLGSHLNIVNLLGAVNRNMRRGDLMVLVEYCCYGNLRQFLLDHKESFVNQLDPETGIPTQCAPNPPSVDPDQETFAFDNTTYENNTFAFDNAMYAYQYARDSRGSGAQLKTKPDSSPSSVRYSVPPKRDSDPGEEEYVVNTSSLLSFAFQCARGMEYLASRKLLHRDLAARNVLLAKNYVVKICDFGLAKDCHYYEDSKYVKKTDGLMPIKWMAIECICERVFTSKSDVWSFGIFLWEMFTLGGNPYAGIAIDEDFVKRLKNGYRLEKPELAPECMSQIMDECWEKEPSLRPTFTELNQRIGSLLEVSVRQYYIDLNEPYEVMNRHNSDKTEYHHMGDAIRKEYVNVLNGPRRPVTNDYANTAIMAHFRSTAKDPIQTSPPMELALL